MIGGVLCACHAEAKYLLVENGESFSREEAGEVLVGCRKNVDSNGLTDSGVSVRRFPGEAFECQMVTEIQSCEPEASAR